MVSVTVSVEQPRVDLLRWIFWIHSRLITGTTPIFRSACRAAGWRFSMPRGRALVRRLPAAVALWEHVVRDGAGFLPRLHMRGA
jgi:hypothetical protein